MTNSLGRMEPHTNYKMKGQAKNKPPPLVVVSSLLDSMMQADKQLANRVDAATVESALQVIETCSQRIIVVARLIGDQVIDGTYVPYQD